MRPRSRTAADKADDIKSPDDAVLQDGWLYIARRRITNRFERRYCVLTKGSNSLVHMKSPKDARTKEISLVLAQVSVIPKGQKNGFQILSREENTYFKAETPEEMNQWIDALQSVCHSLLTDKIEDAASTATPSSDQPTTQRKASVPPPPEKTTLSIFLQKNDYCADCSRILSEGYQGHIESAFVSLKLGCVLCEECAICHFDILGHECSDVHAMQDHPQIPLFDRKQKPMEMSFLNYMGNKKSNDYWEANLSGYNKPTSSSPRKERKLWVKEKYLRKTFKGSKRGYLSVKRDKKKAKKYWVVLESSTINFFNSHEDMKAQEIIVLQSCGVKVGDDPACPETFTIITPGKTYKLEDKTFPAAMEWANAISVAAASLMKQLTNTDTVDGPKATIPTDYIPSPRERIGAKAIHRHDMETDATEWGKTLTSLLHLEEQIQALHAAQNEVSIRTTEKKILSLDDQQFEVANLLMGLPLEKFESSLSKLVLDVNTEGVAGGPIEALIEHLVSIKKGEDKNFLYSWVLTYRTLTSPTIFMCELSKHFKRNELEIQQNILAFMESWISNHYYDLVADGNAMRMILAFINKTVIKFGFIEQANRFRSILRNQMIAHLIPERVLYDGAPDSIVPEDKKLEFLTLSDLDDKEIARQLCLIDQKLFQAIKPQEFLNLNWIGNDRTKQAPNIVKFLDRFDHVVHWVLTTINKLDKPKRPLMLSKFIQIAKYCKDLRNFNSCMQIMTAIEDTIMLRFDGTWEGISQKYVPILLELRRLMSKSDNYNNLKQELYKRNEPCVPYLQAYLFEIQSLTNEESNFLDEKISSAPRVINFTKFKKIGRSIAEIRRYQRASYILHPQPTVQCFLLNTTAFSPAELSALAQMTHFREETLGYNDRHKNTEMKLPENEAPNPPENPPELENLPVPSDIEEN